MIHAQATDQPFIEDLWTVLLKRWPLVLSGAIVGLLLGLGLAAISSAKYQAQVVVIPAAREGNAGSGTLGGSLGGLAALAGISPAGDMRAESLATLQSRALTRRFIEQQQLMPRLFAKKWDAAKNDWRADTHPPTLWEATEFFRKKLLKIEEDRKSPVITLTVVWTDPQEAAAWANNLVAMANQELRQRAKRRAEQNATFLQEQLLKTSIIETRRSIYTLLESEIKTLMLTENGDEYAFKLVDPAVVPQEKISPNVAINAVAGLAGGLLLCAFVAILFGGGRTSGA